MIMIDVWRLGATAGLRLLNRSNSTYIQDLLTGTRAYFDSLGLLFRAPEHQVRIISGSEEGLSGWITANILMHQLFEKNRPADTYGVLDMGGKCTIRIIEP
jgi:Golgi nucleoside diphosphatase